LSIRIDKIAASGVDGEDDATQKRSRLQRLNFRQTIRLLLRKRRTTAHEKLTMLQDPMMKRPQQRAAVCAMAKLVPMEIYARQTLQRMNLFLVNDPGHGLNYN
jgi:hypothetical protein